MKAEPIPNDEPPEIPEAVSSAAEAVLDRKGIDLQVLYLGEVSDFTDYFVICSGRSDRQVRAIAVAVEERLRADRRRPVHKEGAREGKWILLDYGDLVVHVFDEERREFYRLDKLWADAPRLAAAGASTGGEEPGSKQAVD